MNKQRLHLKAPDNWVNDPNGFIFYKGYYHLFYQYFPYGPRWGTMHWGHAVSKDLVNWEHRGLALYPSRKEDRNGCFSGSAVESNGKMYLFYTGVRYEAVDPSDPHLCLDDQFESSQLVISSDDGFSFDNEHGKKVIIPPLCNPAEGDRTHTRDPKIWKGKDGWYLILGSTVGREFGEVLIYHSTDLDKWDYVSKTFKGPEYGWMWECPDYFETENGGLLFISAMGLLNNGEKEKNQSIWFHAQFDEENRDLKISNEYCFIDYGMDLYAPQTTLDEEGRRTMTAWMRMPEVTEDKWIGMFCSPRIVEIKDGHAFFHLHPNIRKAYSQKVKNVNTDMDEGYMAVFSLEEGESADIGGFVIRRKNNRIYTDRTAVFPNTEGAHLYSETPELKYGCRIEAIVEKHLIEVFINDGEYVISNVVYGLKDYFSAEHMSGDAVFYIPDKM